MKSNNNMGNAKQQPEAVRVMQLLNITAQQYAAFKIRCGRAFLQNILHCYPELVDEIIETKNYWYWWDQQYHAGDSVFLNSKDLNCINTQILGAMYTALHNPYTLPAELLVDSIVFEGPFFTQKPALRIIAFIPPAFYKRVKK
jgi:hypothetical protein